MSKKRRKDISPEFPPEIEENGLYFVPLGGSEQFGVNLNAYICDGEALAVDCGIGFADERHPGVDLLLPDPQMLTDAGDALQGLVITHAHEDHIGAVPYIWERLQCPIYTAQFTAVILRKKFEEKGIRGVPIHVIDPMTPFKVGGFELTFLPVAHSVPHSMAIAIKTTYGQLLHSGDWNLDPRPVLGNPTDPKAFQALAKEGMLAYIGDSTNAEVDGTAGSESEVEIGLADEFKHCNKRIVVTIFSSNIGRVRSIARAAQKAGRQVAVVGRSLHRMIGAAHECGMLDDVQDFMSEKEIANLPEDKVVIIMTGSQGEYRSALARVARGDHRHLSLHRGDTVIFSARAIPGNERSINTVKNNLSAAGVRIITPRDTDNIIHVSGHPCRDEILQIYQWVKPGLVIPVHGERTQLDAQARLAKSAQIPSIVPNNGSIIQLAPEAPEIIGHVVTNVLAVEPKRIIDGDHQAIRARRKLQYTGVLHVSLALDTRGDLVDRPYVTLIGLQDMDDVSGQRFQERLENAVYDYLEDISRNDRNDSGYVAEELRIGLKRFVDDALGLRPKTTVHVLEV